LVDPLVEKSGRLLIPKRHLLDLAHEQPNIGDDFRNRFLLVVGESLIESVLMRLHPPQEVKTKHVELYRRGLIFVPHFYRVLADYEKTEGISLPEYLGDDFKNLSIAEIQNDNREIARIEAELHAREEKEREKAEQQAQALRDAEEKHRLLTDAGDLIAQRRYAQAEEKLRALLALEPANGNAYFYLGQIASQQKRHEEAFDYYREAQASQHAEDWVKAWARVRMGKFLAYQGEFEKARVQFEEVIKLEGKLRGARQEALDLVKRLPESQH
jgi:tetratricopeptide (TPR) repeat protein